MTAIRQPVCQDCPFHLYYTDSQPSTRYGVLMRGGERFCTCGKKARRFGRRDPKRKVPSWCPRRKKPCELRVYGFRSSEDELLDAMLRRDMGGQTAPSAHRYALIQELRTDLTPAEFWKRTRTESNPLPITVRERWIIEIDDGLKPVCFIRTDSGYDALPFFDTGRTADRKAP